MERSRELSLFDTAAELQSFDEYPVFPSGVDPQLHVSRNDRDQPFFLVCDHDTVLVQMSGASRVRMMESPVLWEDLVPGDFLYVPARTPHKIEIEQPSVHARFKSANPMVEGVAWFCNDCGREIHRVEFDVTAGLPQDGYADACDAFNRDIAARTCEKCGAIQEPVDLTGIRWRETADLIRSVGDKAPQPVSSG